MRQKDIVSTSTSTTTSTSLYNHSCERMPELADGSVDLIVTSPPYFVDPGGTFFGPALLRGDSGVPPDYEQLLTLLVSCFGECLRVLKPGGFCAVNVASTRVGGKLYPLPFDLTLRLMKIGFELHEEFIWRRFRGWDRRAGNLIQHPYPGHFYPNRVFEYVLLLRKPGPPIYQGRSDEDKAASAYPAHDPLYPNEVATNVWSILPVLPPHKQGHPCPFPDELAARLIELYSYQGDLVLDPFTGSGTTAKASRLLHRRFVGYEQNPDFVQLAKQRVQEPTLNRERRVCRFVLLETDKVGESAAVTAAVTGGG